MFIKAKKSLGQNFLIDREVLERIISITNITDKEVLEIGPGSGNLTTYILKQKPKKLYVVEKDDDLAILLKEKFDKEIEIINDDILKVSEDKISEQKLSVFGNLPYNISTEILSKWILNIGSNFWFESLVLMFQKEVADRIISEFNSSKYGRLSILGLGEKLCGLISIIFFTISFQLDKIDSLPYLELLNSDIILSATSFWNINIRLSNQKFEPKLKIHLDKISVDILYGKLPKTDNF